jgi:hypothetical protein
MEFLGSFIECYCRLSVDMNFNPFKNNLLQCSMAKRSYIKTSAKLEFYEDTKVLLQKAL